jgi:hypothetical protein
MKNIFYLIGFICCVLFLLAVSRTATVPAADTVDDRANREFRVLCYHDLPENIDMDDYGADRVIFI